ncbi:MAG: sensor histidine kinase, partial [Minisyncoccia bacterium]
LYSQSFLETGSKGGPQLIAAIPRENNSFWPTNSSSVMKNVFEADKEFMAGRPESFVALTTFDQKDAQFFVKGIGNGSMSQYEYRVLEDGKQTVVDWSVLSTPASDSVKTMSTLYDLIYLGGYKTDFGHYLVVDLRRKNDGDIISTAIISWQPIRPLLFNIYTVNELNDFLQRLSHPNGFKMTVAERKKWQDKYGSDSLDLVTGLPNKLVVDSKDNSIIFVLKADIREKEQVQYELVKDRNTLKSWGTNDFDNNFIWLKDLAPGDYLLRVRYSAQPSNTMDYPFQVKPPPGHSIAYFLEISSLIAAFLALIIIVVLYLRQRGRIKKEALRMEKLALEMKGLKSQLNPHFVFNSLNSIQGLINSGRIRESNDYLALFAKIMRETLNLSEINQAPLHHEIEYLDAYLRLEQLRFNFTYDISVDPSINMMEVSFPTLLLQPLVENAVRHGVA